MSEQNQRELARQGDPQAIAAAINHSLKPKGITADVMRDNGRLHVSIEGEQVPLNQQALVSFIRNGMQKLDIDAIHTVKVYGRRHEGDLPLWEEEIALKTPVGEDEFLLQEVDLDEDGISNGYDPEEVVSADFENHLEGDNFDLDEDPEVGHYNPEEDDDFEEDVEATEQIQPDNRGKLLLLLLPLLLLAALAGLHYLGVFKLPFLPSVAEKTETAPAPAPAESPEASPTPVTEAVPETPTDPEPAPDETATPTPETTSAVDNNAWVEGVRAAISAAELAQTAKSKTEWDAVASQWLKATELMKKVPEASPNYQQATERVTSYENNRQVALQRAAQAPN
ncbi:MAG: hypothetical protein ACRC8A_12990 [Microcoleaceae cyanobacterium]